MRTIKHPDVRRAEILDTAEHLFTTKGYVDTTIMDILNAIGIAKGTFYHYYKSKEEVMEAVLLRMMEHDAQSAGKIASSPVLTPTEKLYHIFKALRPDRGGHKDQMIEQFHQPSNAEMHQRSLVLGIQYLAPILAEVAEEGVRQEIFTTSTPVETMEFLLVSAQIMFDEGLFQWEPRQREAKANAFIHIMEVTLGARTGSFDFMLEFLSGS